mmetsp:Transcript_2466/g.2901  ORF Transcript_2466/g.2901 Transcript_2466/m.2901 type:complete len:107 (+) Transcript_2466:400-720(+)
MFENLIVLDGFDKDGEECISIVDDEGEFDFEGEGEGDFGELGDFIDAKDLTEEEKKELEKQGIIFLEGEGEACDEEDEEDVAKAGEKRTKDKETPEEGNKRQKNEE